MEPKLATPWPQRKDGFFAGFMEPTRFEGSVKNVVVEGKVPKELNGVLFRAHPDNQFPPRFEDEEWFAGDGSVFALRFEDGNVDFTKNYIKTKKYLMEHKAKRALYGYYGNPWTALPDIGQRDEKTDLSTANTNIVFHPDTGLLLALDEVNPPYALNPFTLDTIGTWNFGGDLKAFTMTAHPKYDHATRELVCFSNEAEGHCSVRPTLEEEDPVSETTQDKLYYFTVGPHGRITEDLWFENPYGTNMIHDCVVTKKYLVLVLIPQVTDVAWNRAGNKHYAWDQNRDLIFGMVPRRSPKVEDVKWFHLDNMFAGHTANGFDTEDGRIAMDMTLANDNCMPWYPTRDGVKPNIAEVSINFARVYLDPALPGNKHLASFDIIQSNGGEFPRIDDRYQTSDYSTVFLPTLDPNQPTEFGTVIPLAGPIPFFNTMTKLNVKTKEREEWYAGTHHSLLEPVFIPRGETAPEGDGWIIFQRNCFNTMTTDLVLMDTQTFGDGPVAILKLPFKIRAGFHGNWVDGELLRSFTTAYNA